MEFFVNNLKIKTTQSFNLKDLVQYLNIHEHPIALEKNEIFIPQLNWNNTLLKNGDKIEIVTLVGGG